MAYLKQSKTEAEIKSATVSKVKQYYNELAKDYNRIIEQDLILCPCCGEFVTRENFYTDKRYVIGLFPQCKKCVLAEVEQRKNKNDKPNETKESVQRMLQKMDLPYIDSLYESLQTDVANEINEKNKKSPFLAYLPPIKSLPNWKGKTYKDSEFGVDGDEAESITSVMSNRKPRKEIIKIFGTGFSNEDYLYLQDQYDDWKSRTQVDSKSQETYIIQICFKQLEIWKAQKSDKDTDKLIKSLNDLMNGANLQPRQNVGNAATDSLTFGQLIEKWELEKPIPEPLNEFKDPDNIGKFLRVWFKGSLMRAVGLDGGYAKEYDDYITQYSVEKPTNIDDDDSVDESMYEKVFGREE